MFVPFLAFLHLAFNNDDSYNSSENCYSYFEWRFHVLLRSFFAIHQFITKKIDSSNFLDLSTLNNSQMVIFPVLPVLHSLFIATVNHLRILFSIKVRLFFKKSPIFVGLIDKWPIKNFRVPRPLLMSDAKLRKKRLSVNSHCRMYGYTKSWHIRRLLSIQKGLVSCF